MVMTFSQLLVNTSQELLKCGLKIEKLLAHVLNVAEECSPEIAMVTADALTKLTGDISSAPLFIAEKTNATGKDMVRIIMTLGVVLHKAQPYEVRGAADLQKALDVTKAACAKNGLDTDASVLMAFLVKEIARVYVELRSVLRRQNNAASKKLFRTVQNFIKKAKHSILCFSYNSTKMLVCLKSANTCGGRMDQASARAIIKNVYKLQNNTRAMAVLTPYHQSAIQKTLDTAKAA